MSSNSSSNVYCLFLMSIVSFTLVSSVYLQKDENILQFSGLGNKNENINLNSDLIADLSQNVFTSNECFEICSAKLTSLAKFCNCPKVEKNYLNCQVLCFIGQGGKACNCNYAPFVGRR